MHVLDQFGLYSEHQARLGYRMKKSKEGREEGRTDE